MNGIKLPRLYLSFAAAQPKTDAALKFDHFARTALESLRSSYNPLPTASKQEFAAFFSEKNYKYLYSRLVKEAGNLPDQNELYETMIRAFASIAPRSEEADPRRDLFGPDITKTYVDEMNTFVIDHQKSEVIAANKLWDHLAKYRHGPVGWDGGADCFLDSRARPSDRDRNAYHKQFIKS